jgi:flagellar hook protein FlgE
MPISQSLYTGVTGLSVNSDSMAVVANNIANANAKGFKKDRAEFADMLSIDLSTGSGSAQIGRGARLRDVRTMHSQGGLAVTDNLTDMAIQGMGFFVVSNSNSEVQESAGRFYTRLGSFIFDKNGYLSDSKGGRVQGYLSNDLGAMSTRLQDIRIETNSIPPQATTLARLDINLDSRMQTMQGEFDLNKAELSSNFNNTITIFDSQGGSHQMTTYFKRIDDSEGISWEWHAAVDGKEVVDGGGDKLKEIGRGTVKFDPKGLLLENTTDFSEVNFTGGALQGQVIDFDFGKTLAEGGNGVGASTSIAAKAVTNFHSQNGYEAGNIKSLRVDLDGTIRGIYTNGVTRQLGAIALATFESQDALMKAGNNQFYSTVDSGPPKIGMAQTGTRGSIFASSLEESNVDLAQEFVQMIMTQRGFQANSRSITTTDSMYEEVINLKR